MIRSAIQNMTHESELGKIRQEIAKVKPPQTMTGRRIVRLEELHSSILIMCVPSYASQRHFINHSTSITPRG